MWLARINVRGNVLTAPVRLMKSPRNGKSAEISVLTAMYPPLAMILNTKFFKANGCPLIPNLVSMYSYVGLANIYKQRRRTEQKSNGAHEPSEPGMGVLYPWTAGTLQKVSKTVKDLVPRNLHAKR